MYCVRGISGLTMVRIRGRGEAHHGSGDLVVISSQDSGPEEKVEQSHYC